MYRRLRQPYVFAAVGFFYYIPRGRGLQGKKRDFPHFAVGLKDFLPKTFEYAQKQLSNVHFEL